MQLPWAASVWWCSVLLLVSITSSGGGVVASVPTIKIGALLSVNSSIGQVALASIQLAVLDINANASILPGYELSLLTMDSTCDAFEGAASAVELLQDEVVAVIGPQSSMVAQFVVTLGAATQVPVVSFSATDPSLTKASNPYFLRLVHNDELEMATLASIVELYGWREVAAVSTNDYVGIDTLDSLTEDLAQVGIDLTHKASLPSNANKTDIINVLNYLNLLEARVYVVHLQLSLGRLFFTTAQSLNMVTSGYVWLVSEAMSNMLDGLSTTDPLWAATQGVLAVRSYIPPSPELDTFEQRLSSQLANSSGEAVAPITIYGLYAYDAVTMVARAIRTYLDSGQNFTFIPRSPMPASARNNSGLASLNILNGGSSLLQTLKDTQFVGLSGPVQVDSNGDVVGASYEILNLIGKSPRVVGYWNSAWGFSQSPSSSSNGSMNGSTAFNAVAVQKPTVLQDVIWPGGSAQIPRGWAVVKNGEKLQIVVPLKTGFPQFVDIETDAFNVTTFHGFCIDVFQTAVSYLPYPLNYTFVAFGNGSATPSYDALVQMVADKVYDAGVGDITITMARSEIVDFTQPYTTSGLVVVVPTQVGGSGHAWAFMRPFTPLMWCTTGLFFLFTGGAIWILEHKKNREFRGRPKKQLVTLLWFIFSTLFFSQRENTKSTLGRAVLIIWLFVVLIVTSSYTASLTSILTVQQLIPTIQGIAGLVNSNLNIGYQAGSFVADYLLQLNVPSTRLIPLGDQTAYANALKNGVVGAIVDELPYIEVFLANECQYTIAGQEFTKSGWGFAFPKGSQLAVDISTAILQMSENGQLQQLTDFYLNSGSCASSGSTVTSNELGLDTFWGLFLITGVVSIICVVFYYARLIRQHHRQYKDDGAESDQSMSRSDRRKSFIRSLVTYIEEAETPARNRDDGVRSNRSIRKSKSQLKHEEGVDSGCSARSEDPGLNCTTPED